MTNALPLHGPKEHIACWFFWAILFPLQLIFNLIDWPRGEDL